MRKITLALVAMLTVACGPVEPASQVADSTAVPPGAVVIGGETVKAISIRHAGGELMYVPAYSHIFHRNASRQIDLAVTLSVRNSDPEYSITVNHIGYYDDNGALVRDYATEPIVLGPLSSRAFVVDESDRTAGVGANFLVEWRAEDSVSAPVVEAVMISTASAQGITFVSRGFPVRVFESAE
ncbi:MAG: DUF3124 domain-containing protein [Rhodothermales bacterium]|nr:DUF3124 domain-containing protein [Rhodothermales bacterium]MBO6779451.1 DUF3124 domain-containing protein [Rhodothermales bacterium]